MNRLCFFLDLRNPATRSLRLLARDDPTKLRFASVRFYSIPQEVKNRRNRRKALQENPFPSPSPLPRLTLPQKRTVVFTELTPDTIIRSPTADEKTFRYSTQRGDTNRSLEILRANTVNGIDVTNFVPSLETFHLLFLKLREKLRVKDITEAMFLMKKVGVKPNAVTYNILLSAYVETKDYENARKIYDKMIELHISPTTTTFGTLLKAYREEGSLQKMFGVIEEMHKTKSTPDAPIFNMLIDACGRLGNPEKSRSILNAMTSLGSKPNMKSYTSLIQAFARNGQPEKAEDILREMWEKDVIPNSRAYTLIIDSYGRKKLPQEAFRLFREYQQRSKIPADVQLYTALLCTLGNSKYISRAFSILYEMKQANVQPNGITYAVLIEIFKKSRSPAKAYRSYLCMKKLGFDVPDRTLSTLLEVFTECNDTNRGLEIMDEMKRRGLHTSLSASAPRLAELKKKPL